jgi:membrane protease YdiL (CAAX protease family)
LGASLLTWGLIAWRSRAGEAILPAVAKPNRPRPAWAVLGAFGWTAFVLLNRLMADLRPEPADPNPAQVWMSLFLSVGVFVIMALLLFGTPRFTPREAGWTMTGLTVPVGVATFFAAVLPTYVLLLLSLPFRSRETQHQLLQLVGQSPDVVTLAGLAITVAVFAPLSEELLFRVTLQGWLTEHLGSPRAILIVAVLFAAVHGWRDGLALVPLALLFGYVYDRRQDYFAVVIAHGLFNAANLLLALLSLPGS